MFNKFPRCNDIRRLNHVLGLVRAPVPIALDIAEYIDDACDWPTHWSQGNVNGKSSNEKPQLEGQSMR